MNDAAAIDVQVVDIRNDDRHKGFIKITCHLAAERGDQLTAALRWATYTNPVSAALACLNPIEQQKAHNPEPAVLDPPPARARRPVAPGDGSVRAPLSLGQRAGKLRREPLYRQWLIHQGMIHPDWIDPKTGLVIPLAKQAATAQHIIFGVVSCSELEPNTPLAEKFYAHESDYIIWSKDLVA